MARLCSGGFVRVVVGFACVSLAFFLASLDPFLHAAPIGSSLVSGRAPAVSINRDRKGDRLPVSSSTDSPKRTGAKGAIWWDLHRQGGTQTRPQVPIGCDPAFSPVTSPSLATVFGRCAT
jgi:hypothetical protein